MHEIRLAQRLLEEAIKQGAKRKILVEVGELSEIEDHHLKEALEAITSWEIQVKEKAGKIKCECGYQGKASILDRGHDYCIFQCPRCQNKKPQVLEGGEIKLVGVE